MSTRGWVISMKNRRNIKIQQAAYHLDIGSKTLYKLLRNKKIINSNNVALDKYVKSGEFVIDHKTYVVPTTGKDKSYYITLVTPKGMSLLRDIVNQYKAEKKQ